jgi:molybdenum cofactor cytidylyltransferase
MTVRALAASNGLWCVLLAAGGSRRLGYPKQLIRYRARPMILRAVDAAESVTPGRVLVVLGAHSLRLRALLARNYSNLTIINNTSWRDGIASSLRAAINTVPPAATGVLVLLSDQPGLGSDSLQRLVAAWQRQPHRAVAAGYGGGLGVPAILPRRVWRQLRELTGDAGAKAVLGNAGSNTMVVNIPEAAFDVDTSEDRRRLERR